MSTTRPRLMLNRHSIYTSPEPTQRSHDCSPQPHEATQKPPSSPRSPMLGQWSSPRRSLRRRRFRSMSSSDEEQRYSRENRFFTADGHLKEEDTRGIFPSQQVVRKLDFSAGGLGDTSPSQTHRFFEEESAPSEETISPADFTDLLPSVGPTGESHCVICLEQNVATVSCLTPC